MRQRRCQGAPPACQETTTRPIRERRPVSAKRVNTSYSHPSQFRYSISSIERFPSRAATSASAASASRSPTRSEAPCQSSGAGAPSCAPSPPQCRSSAGLSASERPKGQIVRRPPGWVLLSAAASNDGLRASEGSKLCTRTCGGDLPISARMRSPMPAPAPTSTSTGGGSPRLGLGSASAAPSSTAATSSSLLVCGYVRCAVAGSGSGSNSPAPGGTAEGEAQKRSL
mmetsp:Transcript_147800/g.474446  ORF Transcript_147800/g.474446 Transcript_147800/m.474446 type:complete len:227 (+) Transcript_147800:136-816(+)